MHTVSNIKHRRQFVVVMTRTHTNKVIPTNVNNSCSWNKISCQVQYMPHVLLFHTVIPKTTFMKQWITNDIPILIDHVTQYIPYEFFFFSFMCMLCTSLFVLSYFWPLCCLSFFDLRILITPLVYSNFLIYVDITTWHIEIYECLFFSLPAHINIINHYNQF